MLTEKYREIVGKQSAVLRSAAAVLQTVALPVLAVMVLLFLVVAGAGIALSYSMNEDANDFMSPVGSVYLDRYNKYKDVFPENSTSNYQGHWIMRGLGMYVSVVMYAEDAEGNSLPVLQPVTTLRRDSLSNFPEQTVGLDTMNRFWDMVENHNKSSFKQHLCARNWQQPTDLTGDNCYRMDLKWFYNRNCNEDLCAQLLHSKRTPEPATDWLVEFPSIKAQAGNDVNDLSNVVVPIAEILGTDVAATGGFDELTCEGAYGIGGGSIHKYNATCYNMTDSSQTVHALRYAWHLSYDTPEQQEQAQVWMDDIEAMCNQFEQQVNVLSANTSNTKWKFMCYKSTSISDGAKLAIKGDMTFVVIIILLSLMVPTLVLVKPCARNNAALLMLAGVGLFLLTLLATVGLGSLFGLEVIYSFIIAVLFLLWSFSRAWMLMIESLKGFLANADSYKTSDGSTGVDAFQWFFSYWSPVVLGNGVVIGVTSLLCCCATYKLVWATAGFVGVFFLLTSLTVLFIFFPIVALVLKSRDKDGNCCLFGREDPNNMDIGILAKLKSLYTSFLVTPSHVVRGIVVALFALVFIGSLIYSICILTTPDSDPTYYGYDRRDIVAPDDNVNYMLDVLTKYYPNNGPLVQMIFNNKAVYWNQINETDETDNVCQGVETCSFHIDMMLKGVFKPFWDASELSWPNWIISFYVSLIRGTTNDAEASLTTKSAFQNAFNIDKFNIPPLYSIAPDVLRIHDVINGLPMYEKLTGDPYTRMFIRQKYNSHSAAEVGFLRDYEQAHADLVHSKYPRINEFFPADSFEIYSNLFEYYEQSRDVVSRTFIMPAVVIGALLCLLFMSVVTMPHPLAHFVIFLNVTMLFFEMFAIQVLLGTTVNNFAMAFYFLIYVFAVDYTLFATHGYLKFVVEREQGVPAPSPLPAMTIIAIAALAFIILLAAPIYSQVGVAVRNCVFVFGIVGPLHELLFVPSLLGLLVCPGSMADSTAVKYDANNGNPSAAVELLSEGKSTNGQTTA
jgi:hypothetical protein